MDSNVLSSMMVVYQNKDNVIFFIQLDGFSGQEFERINIINN